MTPEESKLIKEEDEVDQESAFNQKYGLLGTLYSLTNKDISKVNDLLELGLIEVFNYLSWSVEMDNVLIWKNEQ